MITLHESNDNKWTTLGLGVLRDAMNVRVTEELNGLYELSMEYPIDAPMFSEIKFGRIILSKTCPHKSSQPFRIYSISTPINRIVTVNAAHISYDLSGYITLPFAGTGIVESVTKLVNNIYGECPFNFYADGSIVESGDVEVDVPKSVRAVLGEHISEAFKLDFTFDRLDVIMDAERGSESDLTIVYGKNLLDINQEENNSNVYTAVFPYWVDEDGEVTINQNGIVKTPGDYGFTKILPLDLSEVFESKPTSDEMTDFAAAYIIAYSIGTPEISINVSFLQLVGTEYETAMFNGKINLGDTLTVQFPEANINAKARCIKTVYNPLANRYESLELGDAARTLADSIISSSETIDSRINSVINSNKAYVDKVVSNATKPKEGSVLLYPSDKPEALLAMDSTNIADAQTIWKLDKSGLSVSKNGHGGNYTNFTQNEKLLLTDATVYECNLTQIKANNVSGDNVTVNKVEVNDGVYKTFNGSMVSGVYGLTSNIQHVGTDRTDSSKTCEVSIPNQLKTIITNYDVFITNYTGNVVKITNKTNDNFTVQSDDADVEFSYIIVGIPI